MASGFNARLRLDFTVIPQLFYRNEQLFLEECLRNAGTFLAGQIGKYYDELIFSSDWDRPDFQLDPGWMVKPDQIRSRKKEYPNGVHILYVSQPEPAEETGDYCKAYILRYKPVRTGYETIELFTIELCHPADRCIGTILETGERVRLDAIPASMEQALDKIHGLKVPENAPVKTPEKPVEPKVTAVYENQDEGWTEIHYTDENGHEMRVYGKPGTMEPSGPVLSPEEQRRVDVGEMARCMYALLDSLNTEMALFRDALSKQKNPAAAGMELTAYRMQRDIDALMAYLTWITAEILFDIHDNSDGSDSQSPKIVPDHFYSLDMTLMPYRFLIQCFPDMKLRSEQMLQDCSYSSDPAAWLVLSDAVKRLPRFEQAFAEYETDWEQIKTCL